MAIIAEKIAAIEKLLLENRKIQDHVNSMICNIEFRLVVINTLFLSLRTRRRKRNETNETESLGTNIDTWFRFTCGSRVYAPPLCVHPSYHCHALAPRFRWNQRAIRSLKRQVERMELGANTKRDLTLWQVVADAVNYDSKATLCVDGFQCYLHYQQLVKASASFFSPEEDQYIAEYNPGSKPWTQLVTDILHIFGCSRTAFQVAQRYRKLKREKYEYTIIPDKDDTWLRICTEISNNIVPETEVLVQYSIKMNIGRKIPWVTEESICKAISHRRVLMDDTKETLMQRNIYAVLLSDQNYASSGEVRLIFLRLLQCDPLDMVDALSRARWRFSQVSLEQAAQRLASSLQDVRERILARVLRWYETVYTSDFFKVSLDIFGQRDGALACFIISRDYERQRRRATPYTRLNLL
ncbi:uncharacterized protein TM35_000017270 [Trypanosoma theileri]|uniref:Uncharacterized protein n=1 Tax=Trypanosoma theileri TaxID=67003 RepID=A0A1X0PBK3_9TRYP|nr:uncharacterized protein TM35_000017270 [Trypanosoma theileri]ORC93850.1 hypothetical protein TM35_000017270 [Trypanosoma theileri]